MHHAWKNDIEENKQWGNCSDIQSINNKGEKQLGRGRTNWRTIVEQITAQVNKGVAVSVSKMI